MTLTLTRCYLDFSFFDRALEVTKMADHSYCESPEVEQLRLESILGSLKFINEARRTLYGNL